VTEFISRIRIQKAMAVLTLILAFAAGACGLAQGGYQAAPDKPMPGQPMPQQPMPQQAAPQQIAPYQGAPDQEMSGQSMSDPDAPSFSETELRNLVAPIALYPDALLSQILVASTYPLEIVEAQQWLQQNPYLRGRELMAAAQQQNWDPSVQALVAFPDVVARLSRNVQWTTELGNAFLAQQADVMNAVQNLRAEARESGRLQSTPQFSVNTETQGQQSAIEIQPADPQTMYVPNYDPYAVWGPPAAGAYPALPYAIGRGFGAFFGTVANLAGLFPGFGGLMGPRSWGWALSWLAQALFVNNSFFGEFGFHNWGGGFRGSSVWVHDGRHRLGVPYGNRFVAARYGRGSVRAGGEWRGFGNEARVSSGAEARRPGGPYRSGGESFSRGNSPRGDGGSNWRTFGQASRANDRGLAANRGGSGGFGNSGDNRERSFAGSRTFGSGSRYNGVGSTGTTRGTESSRTFAANRSRGDAARFSGARMPAERGASRGESRHGFSSRAPKSHAPKFHAPKVAKSHFSKPHGGGHGSGGHGGKRSHRG
jgi:hypothetical protein